MNYPELVPKCVCKTPITVVIETEGLSEDGAPVTSLTVTTVCNYQDGGRRIYDDQKKIINVSGTALFNGDLAPDLANITSGYATVNGVKRNIVEGRKNRNPDGTVNYTELWLV